MPNAPTIEGTGEELRAHLARHPKQRFRLVPLQTDETANGSEGEDVTRGVPSTPSALDALCGRVPRRPRDPDAWRKTIGMFKDDPVKRELDAEAIRLRNAGFPQE